MQLNFEPPIYLDKVGLPRPARVLPASRRPKFRANFLPTSASSGNNFASWKMERLEVEIKCCLAFLLNILVGISVWRIYSKEVVLQPLFLNYGQGLNKN